MNELHESMLYIKELENSILKNQTPDESLAMTKTETVNNDWRNESDESDSEIHPDFIKITPTNGNDNDENDHLVVESLPVNDIGHLINSLHVNHIRQQRLRLSQAKPVSPVHPPYQDQNQEVGLKVGLEVESEPLTEVTEERLREYSNYIQSLESAIHTQSQINNDNNDNDDNNDDSSVSGRRVKFIQRVRESFSVKSEDQSDRLAGRGVSNESIDELAETEEASPEKRVSAEQASTEHYDLLTDDDIETDLKRILSRPNSLHSSPLGKTLSRRETESDSQAARDVLISSRIEMLSEEVIEEVELDYKMRLANEYNGMIDDFKKHKVFNQRDFDSQMSRRLPSKEYLLFVVSLTPGELSRVSIIQRRVREFLNRKRVVVTQPSSQSVKESHPRRSSFFNIKKLFSFLK